MKKFYSGVIKCRHVIMAVFLVAAVICGYCKNLVKVDYDMNDYLPESSPSTVALDVMNQEFDGAIPNARVMLKVEDKKEALDYKEKLEAIDGVISVSWLDDAVPLDMPFSMYPEDTLETYYKDGYALFQVTIEEEKRSEVVPEIYELIGEDNAMTGSAVSTALATTSTVSEIQKISVIAVLFLLVILTLTTTSWAEPLITVIGFLALIMMRFGIGPDLGLALAKGIAISLLTVFLFMPGWILVTYKWMDKTRHKSFMPSFRGFGKLIRKVMYPVGIIFLFLIVPAYMGSNSNSYYYGSSHIFGSETRLGQDTEKIEEVFGKSDNYVLMVPKGDTITEQKLLDELKEVSEITSMTALREMIGPAVPASAIPDKLLKKLQSENYERMVLNVAVDYEGEETVALVEEIREIAQKYYPDEYYFAGEGVSTYDLMDTITADMVKVNLLAIGAVFVVLLLTMKSVVLPVILVLTIETAIWINLSIPYIYGQSIFYIAYLIISSIQLDKKESIVETISNVTVSILTSGITLTVVGFLLGIISTHGLLSQLGYFLGRGTLCSMFAVLFVLPCFLYVTDGIYIERKKKKGEK